MQSNAFSRQVWKRRGAIARGAIVVADALLVGYLVISLALQAEINRLEALAPEGCTASLCGGGYICPGPDGGLIHVAP